MEREYPGWMVADMLSSLEAYLTAKQRGHKDAGAIGNIYRNLLTEEIKNAISENKGSFRTYKSIKKHIQGRSNDIEKNLSDESYEILKSL